MRCDIVTSSQGCFLPCVPASISQLATDIISHLQSQDFPHKQERSYQSIKDIKHNRLGGAAGTQQWKIRDSGQKKTLHIIRLVFPPIVRSSNHNFQI